MKNYLKPEAEYISFVAENITEDTGNLGTAYGAADNEGIVD